MSFHYTVSLVAFSSITTTLFKTTLQSMARRGMPVQLHQGHGLASVYLIDTDNEEACDAWRILHPILPGPIILIGKNTFDFKDVPVLSKPLKFDALSTAILSMVQKEPPAPTMRWQRGYDVSPKPIKNPLAYLSPKALVVDDNATMRQYIGLKLSTHGIDIEEASCAEDILQKEDFSSYLCIFMDVMMPGLDGYEACKFLRNNKNVSIPIIMVTTLDSTFDKMRGQKAGAYDYLVKPIDDVSFNSAIQRILLKR